MRMIVMSLVCAATLLASALGAEDMPTRDYRIQAVPFTAVRVSDGFWAPRLETARRVTIPHVLDQCESTGRIANFAKAGGLTEGPFVGMRFNDSDVFKALEGAAYALALQRGGELETRVDALIDKIAAAQEPDGYLYTPRTIDAENLPNNAGEQRWSSLDHSHELYNLGHLIEAAVAHHDATGKRSLLDVAIRAADLIDREFGPDGRHDPPGHQEIELALVRLHRLTGAQRYLDLAHFFLEQRGRAVDRELYGAYSQDHLPVVEQTDPIGHAVRAVYMYCGMADVAALGRADNYVDTLNRIWETMVGRRMYVTGGIGARHGGESFGDDYELPNASAYCETCAAIANVLWNQRMFLLHADGRYVDVLERALYNGFLAGVGLDGATFFYVNPLGSFGTHQRRPWYGCACCPTNVARFLPSLPGYIYAREGDTLYVNLFVAGEYAGELAGTPVTLRQETDYPWDGAITLHVSPATPQRFTVNVRIPGWARNQPVPSDLYRFVDAPPPAPTLTLNGAAIPLNLHHGYARIERQWSPGDVLKLTLPMPVRPLAAHPQVRADRGRTALQRGPLIYCVEGVDHDSYARDLLLPERASFTARRITQEPLGELVVLTGQGQRLAPADDDPLAVSPVQLTAIPYYAWCHRGATDMQVWLPQDPARARPRPAPDNLTASATVSASHVQNRLGALNDQLLPTSADDHGIPRFTWWPRQETLEWVQYEFDEPVEVSATRVHWFDDTGQGQCRVPTSWRLLYRTPDGDWQPVETDRPGGIAPDRANRLRFEPVNTTALRLEVQLQESFSGGILEWSLE